MKGNVKKMNELNKKWAKNSREERKNEIKNTQRNKVKKNEQKRKRARRREILAENLKKFPSEFFG